MKKIIIFLYLFFTIFLVSCNENNKTTKDDVKIYVNDPINIEISKLDDFPWKSVITIFVNGKKVAFGDSTVKLIKEGNINTNEQYLYVIEFLYDGITYKQEFKVNVYENKEIYTINLILYNNKIKSIQLNKNESLNVNDINVNVDGMIFDGWYYDSLYSNPFDPNKDINKDFSLYGKWIKKSEKVNLVNDDVINNTMIDYINSLIADTKEYIPSWNQEGFKGRWNYIDGVFLNSIVNLYYETNNVEYKDFFINYINYYLDSNGMFINPETLEYNFRSYELDSICESKILFDAYEFTKDNRYIIAINKTYEELIKVPYTSNGINFSHKNVYENQIWLDGMYMYVPFYARYANLIEDNTIFTEIKKQYEYIRNNMFDEEKNLYYHGHDTEKNVFWADKETGNSKSFWLRSIGWYIVSLVDVIEYFPNGNDKNYLIDLLEEAINGILRYQDHDSNMFYQIVDLKGVGYIIPTDYLVGLKNTDLIGKTVHNYLESSGSSMISYAIMKASRLGYLDQSYNEIGKEIYKSIYSLYFCNNTLSNICITAGLGPDSNVVRDGSIYYYLAEKVGNNDAKGVGPFIMAYLEFLKAC